MTTASNSAASETSLLDLEDLRARIDVVIADWLAEKHGNLAPAHREAEVLISAAGDLLAGGKRMRPALCYWSWRAHGGKNFGPIAQAVVTIGAALELFQAAALVHDDVMDDSDTRRGAPAAHRAFEAKHRAEKRRGDAGGFGVSAAILLGDLLLIGSEELFAAALADIPAVARPQARAVFDALRTDVTLGQYLDVLTQTVPWGEDPEAELARAREVVRQKSARYSVEQPLMLGAALAGATETGVAEMSAFGLPLGEAFQLRDDLLDISGDPKTLGKPAGADLREGKRTVVFTIALARAQGTVRQRLLEQVGKEELTSAQVAQLSQDMAECGAVAEVEELIDSLSTTAFETLAKLHLEEPGVEVLQQLARAVVDRSA